MAAIGTNRAALLAMQLLEDLQSIRFRLLVRIGVGVLEEEEEEEEEVDDL